MSAIATAITTTSSTGVDEKEYHQTTIDIMTTSVAPPPISPPYVRLSTQQVPNPVGRRGGSRIKHSPRALHHKHERSSEEEGTSSSGLLQPPSSPRYLQATIASSGVLHNSVADSTWCRYALASNTTPDASGTATTTTTPHEPLRPWLRNHESPAIVWNERRVLDAYPVSGGGTTPRFEHSSAGTPQRGLPQSLRVFRVSGADRPGTCAAFGSASARVLGWSNHSSYDTPTTPQSGGRPASHIKPSSATTTLLRTSLRQRAPRPPSPPCLTPTLTSLKRNARDLRTAQKEATRLSNEHCQHVAADDGDDSAVVSSSGAGNDAHQQEVGGHPHTSSVVKDAAPHSSGRLPPQAEGFLHAMSDVFARALHHHQLESRRALLLLADNYEGRLKNAEQPATTTLSSPSRGHRTNAATTSLPTTPRSTAAARRLGSASSTKS